MRHEVIAAINVINTDRLQKFLDGLKAEPENSDPRVQKWISSNLRNWLLRDENPIRIHLTSPRQLSTLGIHQLPDWLKKQLPAWPDNLYFVPLNPALKEKIEHALGYVRWLLENEGIADLGRLGAATAIKDGEELMRKRIQEKVAMRSNKDATAKIMNSTGGYYWVNVISVGGLIRESSIMGHCVGWDSMPYRKKLVEGKIQIWSLRDHRDDPWCTIECDSPTKTIKQIRGRGLGVTKGVTEHDAARVFALLQTPWAKTRVKRIHAHEIDLNWPVATAPQENALLRQQFEIIG